MPMKKNVLRKKNVSTASQYKIFCTDQREAILSLDGFLQMRGVFYIQSQ